MVGVVWRNAFCVGREEKIIKKKMKRAQMKIQQMAFMLIAVTLFFVLAGMFVLIVRFSDLKESASVLEEKNAMLLVTKLANSPEFACGRAFDGGQINCIDSDKVMMLKESIAKYVNFWGVSNIEIRKIYPKMDNEVICDLEKNNYPDCNVIRIRSKNVTGYDSSNFVSLCRKESDGGKVYDKCDVAKVIVSYEEVGTN